MKNLRLQLFTIILLICSSTPLFAEDVVSISAIDCVQGIHKQPQGPFALYIFCDDALGTNIAIFINSLGAPLSGKYSLGKRFWQGGEWANDVTSYAWLENNQLLLATSQIYGSGAIYKLNLETQLYEIVRPPEQGVCETKLKSVQDRQVEIIITDCETLNEKTIEIVL